MHFYPGQTVGDYSVVELIGGAGTAVYRVKHTLTEREEAFKVVAGAGQGSIAGSQQFLEEIRLQARLRHPHITEVMTAFWADDDLVMVTELPEGKPLRTVLTEGRLAPADAIDVMRQLLEALRYAHGQGVIHRGISPDSILYSPSSRFTKLTDFGLARADSHQRPSCYAAPELLEKEAAQDARADIYACGATMYELLTGQGPNGGTPKTSKLSPALPASVDIIVKKAMEPCPRERYGSAEEFLQALEPLAKALSAQRKAGGLPPEPTGPIAVRRAALAAGAVAAAGLLAFLMQSKLVTAEAVKPRPASVGIPMPATVAPPVLARAEPAPPQLAPVVVPSGVTVQAKAIPERVPRRKLATATPKPDEVEKIAEPTQAIEPVQELAQVSAQAPGADQLSEVAATAAEAPLRSEPAPQPAGTKQGATPGGGSWLSRLNPFRKRNKTTAAPSGSEQRLASPAAANTLR